MQRTETLRAPSSLLAIAVIMLACAMALAIVLPGRAFATEAEQQAAKADTPATTQQVSTVSTQTAAEGQQPAAATSEPAQVASDPATGQQGAAVQNTQQAVQPKAEATADTATTTDGQNANKEGAATQAVANANASDKAVEAEAPAQDLVAAPDASEGALIEEKSGTATYSGVGVTYNTHVENVGWQAYVKNGATAGTSGQALRLEGIHIKLTGAEGLDGSIRYTTHVQNEGWQDPVSDGAMAGTSGKSLRLEGIMIWLTGELEKQYDVLYRTHVQNEGWHAWVKNGALSGTTGKSLRLEAIQIKLSPKTEQAAGKSADTVGVRYDAHVQNTGWQNWVGDKQTAGTEGKGLRVEGLNIVVSNGSSYTGNVEYQAHVQNIGWQDWVSDGAMCGTSGKALRVEALRIRLTGDLADNYDIYYQSHVQNVGWLDWAKNGGDSGSEGCSYRMEAVRIVIKEKGADAPGSTTKPFYSKRWSNLEKQYLNDKNVNELVEVKYTGGSDAQIVLRKKYEGKWITTMTCQGTVGKNGIGKTKEGDGRTPEGDYGIKKAFGRLDLVPNMSYTKLDGTMWICGDSSYYNQFIDITAHPHDCKGEHLVESNPNNNYALFLDYNTKSVNKDAGWGVMLRCTGNETAADSCIEIPESKMREVMLTLTKGARVLIYAK